MQKLYLCLQWSSKWLNPKFSLCIKHLLIFDFSLIKDGFVSHKNHLTGNIEIKKFYQRIPKFIGQSINNTFGKTGDVILVVDPSIHTTESDVMVFDDGFDDDFLDDE